jgi:anaerobic selenocysteine-containing dehydrogenase
MFVNLYAFMVGSMNYPGMSDWSGPRPWHPQGMPLHLTLRAVQHVAYPDRRFHTPSGKVEFWSERAQKAGLSPLPAYTPAQTDAWARYPLQFRQGRTITAFHAFYDEGRALPSLARANVEAELWIHPLDAQQRGIDAGCAIQIYNERGQVRAKARVTEEVQRGVIWMRDGWVGVNSVTNGDPALSPLASDIVDPYGIPGGQRHLMCWSRFARSETPWA